MTMSMAAPWHKTSFDRFLNDRLPQLLTEYVPLIGYTVASTDQYTCQVRLALASSKGEVAVEFKGLPQPDEEGIFLFKEQRLAVVPYATYDDLEQAEIYCVGEQLEAYLRRRLNRAPDDLAWDESLARAWLPLDLWIGEFFQRLPRDDYPPAEPGWDTFVQPLDDTNWLSRHSHLRRLPIKNRQHLFRPGHFGRACPFETPEGPNIGRIVQIALGAKIRDGKLVIVDERPEATLGLEAVMIPLLEHDAPERLLMGANVLRQWIVPPEPEPALVQSGNEPDAPGFWCGRNLLTAFISWGEDTYEDGIVLSESCARRLSFDHAIEPGDKLSNRHGTKGIVSAILPDDEMPHLADGTPVELIFNFISQHARAYFGQIREAVLSRIARAQGKPMIFPPFHGPDERQIRAWLVEAGLPEDGMEPLTSGRQGKPLERPSSVGWVYWGKLYHKAREKLYVSTGDGRGQRLGEYDYYALRETGAFETIRELFNTSATGREEGSTLAERLTKGSIEQAGPPSPQLSLLLKRLAVVGIRGDLREVGLAFRLSEPEGEVLDLASPIAHPWLRDHMLTRLGVYEELPQYRAIVEANTRLKRVLDSGAPESLRQQALAQLMQRVQEFCAALLPPVQFEMRVQFSGRAVLAPGPHLRLDQVGLGEELAWRLFGPLVTRQLANDEVQSRSERAARILDETMARSWVIIHRAPALTPQTFLAFHPVRSADRVIRLHPLACRLLHADFDGDQAAVFLPLTGEAQRETGERLSVAGHLARLPELLDDLLPNDDALWGLTSLSLAQEGRAQIADILSSEMAGEMLTHAALGKMMQQVLQRDGVQRTLEILERLAQLGFEAARISGASINPFVGSQFTFPPAPAGERSTAWNTYQREVGEWLATGDNYASADLGPQLLAVKSGAWGEMEQLVALLRTQGVVADIWGKQVPIHHGYRDGLEPAEIYAVAIGAREAFAQVQREWSQIAQEIKKRDRPQSFHVLARAMRAEQPALVFAHAASIGEVDPLTDRDSRLFVGLPVQR